MTQLYLTFEGPRISKHGVPVDALVSALQGIQDALQLMVEHLANYQRKRGKPPKWIKDQSVLQLSATRPGSFVAELTLEPARYRVRNVGKLWRAGSLRIAALGAEDIIPTLPEAVVDRLWEDTACKILVDVRLWLGDAEDF